jgi:16S rRNA (uracil1498-N3)-methyltransferase
MFDEWMNPMARRAHVPQLHSGEVELEPPQAHHIRDVLRLKEGEAIELFDHRGAQGQGTIIVCSRSSVRVRVDHVDPPPHGEMELTIAAAVPKGARADWMVEKLSELGVARFIPLRTERSVVAPEGKNKMERWSRLASEAARQSRRRGVMDIEPLSELDTLIGRWQEAESAIWQLSTQPGAQPLAARPIPQRLLLLVGPEGGWSDREAALFSQRNIPPVSLTATILRIETAAVAAAAIALSAALAL